MRNRFGMMGAVLLLAAMPTPPAAAKEPVALAPSTPWNVNYAKDHCRLARKFGEGKQAVFLILDQMSPGDSFRLTLGGAMMKGRGDARDATIRFGDVLPELRPRFFPGAMSDGTPAWIFGYNIRIKPGSAEEDSPEQPVTPEDEATVTEVLIGRPLYQPLLLKTGPMKPSFDAMRACTDELLDHWGIDVARHRQLSRPATPIGSPGSWLNSGDYPVAMLSKWLPGMVQFRLSVGADGVPTDCHVQRSTNDGGFDEAVCKGVMRRARFEPALDKDGQPLASWYVNSVLFQF